MSLLEKPYMKLHLWVAGILTILIVIAADFFSVPGYNEVILHPQFPDVEHFDRIIRFFEDNHLALAWYRLYFLLDFLWAPIVAYLLFRIMTDTTGRRNGKLNAFHVLTLAAMVAALGLDWLENTIYLLREDKWHSFLPITRVVGLKTAFYGIFLLFFLVHLYTRYIHPRLADIRFAIKATRFSLLIILLIFLLSTGVDQGSTVIIHLLGSGMNIIGGMMILMVLAMACAHYPDYIEKGSRPNEKIKWRLEPATLRRWLGLGFIVYTYDGPGTDAREYAKMPVRQSKYNTTPFFENFRKNTGSLLLLVWIYTLLFIYRKYCWTELPVLHIMEGLVVAYYFLFSWAYRAKKRWEAFFAERQEHFSQAIHTAGSASRQQALRSLVREARIRPLLWCTIVSFLAMVACTLAAAWCSAGQWNITGLWLMLATLFGLVFYVCFQHSRKMFSFYILPWYWRWIWVHRLQDDLAYVQFYSAAGWISFVVILMTTAQPSYVNTLVLILLFFYLYYGFFILLLKHHIYYRSPGSHDPALPWVRLLGRFFSTYAPLLPALVLIWMIFAGKAGNGLHVLWPVGQNPVTVGLDDYLDRFDAKDSTAHTHYWVASYGGGLRASVWTMLMMDQLEKQDPAFFPSTIAMSGVSGGFVGLALYNAIRTEYPDAARRQRVIDTIGRHNILSIEASYLMGYDFVREMCPGVDSFNHVDRAARAMREYASLIQPDQVLRDSMLRTSFRDYWEKGFNTTSLSGAPALIGNTTSTHGRYGVAFSVTPDDFNSVFPGAVDILSVGRKSIGYFDATSTTERFPLFSPSAEIKGKGHFMDGGYFENSGLLSLLNLHEYVAKTHPPLVSPEQTKVILIINSKEAYIRYLLGDTITTKKELTSGELLAILTTVANIDVLPSALESRCRNEFGENFIRIYLPYPIRYQEVVDLLLGTPIDPFIIQDKINASNAVIDSVWNAYTNHSGANMVPPALARVLSDPAYEYAKAMIGHPEVVEALRKL